MSTERISPPRSGVRRAFAGTMVAAVPARFAQLAMTLLLAPRLGPEGFGLFVFAQGFSQLAARIGALGWPTLVLRMIPVYLTEQDWPRLKGLLSAAIWVGLIAGFVLMVATTLVAWAIPMDGTLSWGLILGAVILLPMILRTLSRNMLAGYKHPAKGIVLDEFLPPLITCLAVLALGMTSASTTVVIYGLASALAVGYGALALRRITPPKVAQAMPQYEIRRWMLIALPALAGMSAKLIMNRTDVVMLAPLANLDAVSQYAVALRVTFVQTFPIVVLSSVLGPRLSTAIARGQKAQTKRLYRGGLIFAAGFSTLAGLALILWRAPLMTLLFGAAYADSASVLAVLVLAQIAACLSIPATSFLIMSGREKLFGALTLTALCLNIVLNVLLIPPFGAIGAAWATFGSASLLACFQIGFGLRALRTWSGMPQTEQRDAP